MALIHINRDRESLGKFTEVEVAEGLRSGRFLPGDLAWQEPMETWMPLSTFARLVDDPAEVEQTPLPAIPTTPPEPAWERGEGFFRPGDLLASVRQILAEPVRTFQALPAEGGLSKPIQMAVLSGWSTGAVALAYQFIAALINPEMFFGEAAKSLTAPLMAVAFAGAWIVMPVFIILGVFLSAASFHLGLVLTGGASKPFAATVRALAYAMAATSVLQIVPLCGGYLYPLANVIYSVLALREVHRTDLWRVVVAALLVFLLCCGVFVGMATALGAAMAAMNLVP